MPVEYFDTSQISELPKYFDDLEYYDVSEYSVSFFLSSKIFAFIKYVLLLLVIAGLAGGIQSQKKLYKSKLKSLYTISPFIKIFNSSVHEPYLARKCFPFLQWQCPPLKQMHLSKQFFLTNLHIEVLLLSAKTTNGSVFVSITLLSWSNFFSCKKKSVANTLVAFGLFFIVFIFCKLCGWGKNIFAKVRPIFTVRKGGSF